MKKTFCLLVFLIISNSFFAQNITPLTIREAYNFNVGDTFQYKDHFTAIEPVTYKCLSGDNYYQIIVTYKWISTRKDTIIYTLKEGYKEPFKVFTQTFTNLDSTVEFSQRQYCNYNTGRTGIKCSDTTYLENNKKITVFNLTNALPGYKNKFIEGLGKVYFEIIGDNPCFGLGSEKSTELMYFKNVTAYKFCKPLTMQEVYGFNEGYIFIYKNEYFNIPLRRLDTLYTRKTVLKKQLNLPTSIVYFMKKESINSSAINKISIEMDTFVVKDLDSLALYKVKTNSAFVDVIDKCETLRNSDRNVTGRELTSNRLQDYCQYSFVGRGIGEVRTFTCGIFYDYGTNLIYFKKGTEIWGTPIDFTSSIFTPSVFSSKTTLSPNPSNDFLTLKSDEIFDKIIIIDIQGKVVSVESDFKAAEKNISVTHLPNGIYFTQVFKDKILRGVNKFVVNH